MQGLFNYFLHSMIETLPYSLPDLKILSSESGEDYIIWQPDDIYIVLGRSNYPDKSLKEDLVLKDKVKVLKRPSGGETVVLTPNMLVFSIKISAEKLQHPKSIFNTINSSLITEFSNKGVSDVHSRGISDLSIGEQKILGSSMYLKDNVYFYHAVLNISEKPDFISQYIKHPSREPDYRKGRDHSKFITSLNGKGYNLSISQCREIIMNGIENILNTSSV